ncbi:protein lin-37 homolog [Eudromia elegans]
MLSVKVKVEKPDLEAAAARSRLDAVLQGLLERSDGHREQMDEDAAKTPHDPLSKDSSPSAAGKRPSARFSHHRRKKRREADEGLPEGGPQRHSSYVIRLFERSLDLAPFPEGTPLYPVCRAWMRNRPAGPRARGDPEGARAAPAATGSAPGGDPQAAAGHAGKGPDVFALPPPTAAPPRRVPSPLGREEGAPPPDRPPEPAPSTSSLIYKNMERWKRVRQRWKEAAQRNQQRYAESMRVLRDMYERQ